MTSNTISPARRLWRVALVVGLGLPTSIALARPAHPPASHRILPHQLVSHRPSLLPIPPLAPAYFFPAIAYSPMTRLPGVPPSALPVLTHLAADSLVPPMRLMAAKRRQQVLCLALTMYQEARSQTQDEQIAVAQVVLNRKAHSGETICEVVWADNGSQFQWVRRSLGAILPQETEVWQTLQRLALQVINRRPADITHGATHFYNPELCDPIWARAGTVTARFTQVFLRIDPNKPVDANPLPVSDKTVEGYQPAAADQIEITTNPAEANKSETPPKPAEITAPWPPVLPIVTTGD